MLPGMARFPQFRWGGYMGSDTRGRKKIGVTNESQGGTGYVSKLAHASTFYSAVGDSITLNKLGRIPALAEWGLVPQLDIPYYIISPHWAGQG